jgi:hypothetical protein
LEGKERRYPILSAYHNFPLTNKRDGQVIADALGVVWAGERVRPLLMEVKVADQNPWYAAVECLKQMRLARQAERHICKHINGLISDVERGAWGLVIAPEAYFKNGTMPNCKKLMKALQEKTNARIGFASAKNDPKEAGRLPSARLRWVAGNWPK